MQLHEAFELLRNVVRRRARAYVHIERRVLEIIEGEYMATKAKLDELKGKVEGLVGQVNAIAQGKAKSDTDLATANQTIADLQKQVSDLQGQLAAVPANEVTDADLAAVEASIDAASATLPPVPAVNQ